LMTGVTRYISEEGNIYVTDSSVGSHRFCNANIRMISSDPNASLYLKNLLIPTTGDIGTFKHNVIIYHASGYHPSKDTGIDDTSMIFTIVTGQDILNILSPQAFKEIKDPQSLSKDEGVVIFLTGNFNLSKLREAILTATDYVHLRGGSLPLDASVIVDKSGKTSLVFDPTNSLTQGRVHSGLFSAGNCILKDDHLYRSFNSVTHTNLNLPRNYGDVVEKIGNQSHVTQSLLSKSLFVKGPDSLVFIAQNKKGQLPPLGKVKNSDVLKFWQSGYIDDTNSSPMYRNRPLVEPKSGTLVSSFEAFLNKYPNLPVFVVNRSEKTGDLTSDKLDRHLENIFDGKTGLPSVDVNNLKK